MVTDNITHLEWLRKKLDDTDDDLFREILHYTIQLAMHEEANALCGADYRERLSDRENSWNGYRDPRSLDTRFGTIHLLIPKVRKGSYYPGWLLEPRKRSERALVQVISEAWVKGVSTRKMDCPLKAKGITSISKSLDEKIEQFRNRTLKRGPFRNVWLDATVVKCREFGSVDNVVIVAAIGVNDKDIVRFCELRSSHPRMRRPRRRSCRDLSIEDYQG